MVPHMVPIFPNPHGRPLSDATLGQLIKELGIAAVPHGFRSSFRDWAAERTNTPREVVKAALAHTVRNPTAVAYARSDPFERRRSLMADRAAYLDGGLVRHSHALHLQLAHGKKAVASGIAEVDTCACA